MNKYALAANLIAQVQRAGARHSATDRVLVQQLHDIAMELGAECHHDEGEMMSMEEMRRYAPHPMLKAAVEALVLRHPGHQNQKTHGNRFGSGQAKESLRRLKDDKGAREKYKETARGKSGLTLEVDKIKVGSKKLALPKEGEAITGVGPRWGSKFSITRTGRSKRTGKGEYTVTTSRERQHFYDRTNPARDITRYLRDNA